MRSSSILPVPLDARELPGHRPGRGRGQQAWDAGARARRATRLPQRPGHGASRRPARSASSWIATPPASSPISRWSSSRSWPAAAISRSSTAWCPRRCATLGYDAEADRARSRATRSATARSTDAPGVNHDALTRQGLRRRRARRRSRRRSPPPSTSNSPSTNGRWARNSARRPSASPQAQLDDVSLRHAGARSASRKADIEAANTYCCGAMTLEGAPLPQGRASRRCSIAPIPAAESASASSRSRATSA